MDNLELRHDSRSNTCEAPLQMKSNCGCLLIDDFGRQRIAPAELLNRWIVPLESRHDYLNLPTGKKICIPFEQTILFSTNLKPEDLVDEAFLRRVPFKINIGDPTPQEFMDLFKRTCESMDIPWRPDVIERVMVKHYKAVGRPFRRCHPRDLIHQVKCLSLYHGQRLELRPEYLDIACRNYFGDGPIIKPSGKQTADDQWNVAKARAPIPPIPGQAVGAISRAEATERLKTQNPAPERNSQVNSVNQAQNSQTSPIRVPPQSMTGNTRLPQATLPGLISTSASISNPAPSAE